MRSSPIQPWREFQPSSSNGAFASFRSALLKPYVNLPYIGVRRSGASVVLLWKCQRRARRVAARSSHILAEWERAISMALWWQLSATFGFFKSNWDDIASVGVKRALKLGLVCSF